MEDKYIIILKIPCSGLTTTFNKRKTKREMNKRIVQSSTYKICINASYSYSPCWRWWWHTIILVLTTKWRQLVRVMVLS